MGLSGADNDRESEAGCTNVPGTRHTARSTPARVYSAVSISNDSVSADGV